jgi:hypothetical protein
VADRVYTLVGAGEDVVELAAVAVLAVALLEVEALVAAAPAPAAATSALIVFETHLTRQKGLGVDRVPCTKRNDRVLSRNIAPLLGIPSPAARFLPPSLPVSRRLR